MKKHLIKTTCAILALGLGVTVGAGIGQTFTAKAEVTAPSNPIVVVGEDVNYKVRAVSVRVVDDEFGAGVRFKVAMDKAVFEENLMEDPDGDGIKTMKADVVTGTLLIPEYTLGANELNKETAQINEVTTDSWYENALGQMETCVYVYNIPDKNYASNIVVRGYVTMDGEEIYTQAAKASMAYAAANGDNAGLTEEQIQSLRDTYLTYGLNYYNGETQIGETQAIYYGAKIEKPADVTPEAGYSFDGWYNKAGTQAWNFEENTVNGNMSLYAKFSANTDTPYKVEAYLEQENGEFIATAETTMILTGTTGAEVNIGDLNLSVPAGYVFDANNANNVLVGTIAGDGSLVLKVYCAKVRMVVKQALVDEYLQYSNVTVPQAEVRAADNKVSASVAVKAPDGSGVALENGKLYLAQLGTYTITYTGEMAGQTLTETVEVESVANVAYASGDNANTTTYKTTNNYLGANIAAGDVLTANHVMDFSNSVVSASENGMVLSHTWFSQMTAAQYRPSVLEATVLTLTLTNAENAEQYIQIELSLYNQDANLSHIIFNAYLYGGLTFTNGTTSARGWMGRYAGSEYTNDVFMWVGNNGLKVWHVGSNGNHQVYAINDMFKTGVLTVTAEKDISVEFGYHAGSVRAWQASGTANIHNVTYVSEGKTINAERVFNGQYAKAEITPVVTDKVFVGWFASAEDAAACDESKIVDAKATAITANKTFYAGFLGADVRLEKPLLTQYAVNSSVAPKAKLSYLGVTYDAALSVVAPDGTNVALTDGAFTTAQVGTYTLIWETTVAGQKLIARKTIDCVANVAFATYENADSETWIGQGNNYFNFTLAAGDTLTVNNEIDWSHVAQSASSSTWFMWQFYFANTTPADYTNRDLTVRITNTEDASNYLEAKYRFYNAGSTSTSAQIVVDFYYYVNGEKVLSTTQWHNCYAGSGHTHNTASTISFGNDGLKDREGASNGGLIMLESFFTKGVVTFSSTSGISVATNYLGDARPWL